MRLVTKELKNDGLFVDRLAKKDGSLYDDSYSSFVGLMIRSDLITLIKNESNSIFNSYVWPNKWI